MTQALAEMEMDETRDGRIEFDEFLNWWQADSATKAAGSLAFRLQVSLSLSVSLCVSLLRLRGGLQKREDYIMPPCSRVV